MTKMEGYNRVFVNRTFHTGRSLEQEVMRLTPENDKAFMT